MMKLLLARLASLLCMAGFLYFLASCTVKYSHDDSVSIVSYKTFEKSPDLQPQLFVCFVDPYIEENFAALRPLLDKSSTPGMSMLKPDDFTLSNISTQSSSDKEAEFMRLLNGLNYNMSTLKLATAENQSVPLEFGQIELKTNFVYWMNGSDMASYYNRRLVDLTTTVFRNNKCFSIDLPSQAPVGNFHLSGEFYSNKQHQISAFLALPHHIRWTDRMNMPVLVAADSDTMPSLDIVVKELKVIKQRNTDQTPCVDNIFSYDEWLKRKIVEKTGCRPLYWQDIDTFKKCSSFNEMSNITHYADLTLKTLEVTKLEHDFPPPCTHIRLEAETSRHSFRMYSEKPLTVTNPKTGEIYSRRGFSVSVSFDVKDFMMIEQLEEYTVISYLAEVAGYIGVFLGFSLNQVCDILFAAFSKVRTFGYKK